MLNKVNARVPDNLPEPTGYRMILVMPEIQEKTKGGIFLPEQRKSEELVAGVVAYVAAQGPDCYKGDEFKSAWCAVGDWVLIAKYGGHRMKIDGIECRIVNDNSILAVVGDPSSVQRAEL